jgi:hypothetical protein
VPAPPALLERESTTGADPRTLPVASDISAQGGTVSEVPTEGDGSGGGGSTAGSGEGGGFGGPTGGGGSGGGGSTAGSGEGGGFGGPTGGGGSGGGGSTAGSGEGGGSGSPPAVAPVAQAELAREEIPAGLPIPPGPEPPT